MTRQQVAFLAAGIALGFVAGFAVAWGLGHAPESPALPPPSSRGTAAAVTTPAEPGSDAMMEDVRGRIAGLKQALEQDPDDFPALMQLADMYMQVSMYAQARDYLAHAVDLQPDDSHARTHLGIALGQTGDLPGARTAFERVVALDPDGWQGWLYLAATAVRQGDMARAGAATDRLEALNPTLPQIADLRRSIAQPAGAASP